MNWIQKKIINDAGEEVDSVAPYIISASRSTDIPAFYSKWFFNRLNTGYIAWINPFNQKTQYVSFDETKFIVFWTKDPLPIIPYLAILDTKDIGYYFQITLNDYEKEGLEPNVPELTKRIETFQELSKRIGKNRTIWRFDPLLLSDTLTIDKLLDKIEHVGDRLHKFTEKLVFSFADINMYRKVTNNLSKSNETFREFSKEDISIFSSKLSKLNKKWNLTLSTCAEDIVLSSYGISKNKCIDDELIYQLRPGDKVLCEWLGYKPKSLDLFSSEISSDKNLKDKGQRKACGCIISKDIGMYNTCNHLCAYCYANSSANLVQSNLMKHNDSSQSII
jgi:DNA repair photolyase